MTVGVPAPQTRYRPVFWAALAIVLVAANLRPGVVSVAPLLAEIQRSEGLSETAAGMLTALPVFCFGLLAPAAPVLARRFGIERTLLAAMAVLCLGYVVRSVGPVGALFVGAVLIGAGVAIGNVLLPSLIKRDFAHRTGLMTALYTMSISTGASFAAGVTVPVVEAAGLGWRGGLLIWLAPAVVGLLCWATRLGRPGPAPRPPGRSRVGGLWQDPVAWQVTGFMGLQSLNYFALTAFLPALLVDHGYQPVSAGWLLSLASISGIAGAMVTPPLATRGRRQRGLSVAITAVTAVGMFGVFLLPATAPVAVVLMGFGQTAALGFALTVIALRAPDAAHAAQLSGMAQSYGYMVAALGPFAVGALRDLTAGWTLPLVLLTALLGVQAVCGFLAGRDRLVRRRPVERS